MALLLVLGLILGLLQLTGEAVSPLPQTGPPTGPLASVRRTEEPKRAPNDATVLTEDTDSRVPRPRVQRWFLRGVITGASRGALAQRLTLEFQGVRLGLDFQLNAVPATPDPFRAEGTARIDSNGHYEIEVAARGTYRLRMQDSETNWEYEWVQNTTEKLRSVPIQNSPQAVLQFMSHPDTVAGVSGANQAWRNLGSGRWAAPADCLIPSMVTIELTSGIQWETTLWKALNQLQLPRTDGTPLIVTDANAGIPLVGAIATMTIQTEQGDFKQITKTDNLGNASLQRPTDQMVLAELRVECPEYEPLIAYNLIAMPKNSGGTMTAALMPIGGARGHLFHDSGLPAVGAGIYLTGRGTSIFARGLVEEDGSFQLRPCRSGQLVGGRGSPIGPGGAFLFVALEDGPAAILGPVNWEDLLQGKWSERLPSMQEVEVLCVDHASSTPIEDAAVSCIVMSGAVVFRHLASSEKAHTDQRGKAVITLPQLSAHLLEVTAPGFATASIRVAVPIADSIVVPLKKPRVLEVLCEDRKGNPVEGVQIHLGQSMRTAVRAVSDAAGRASLAMKPDEGGQLSVSHKDYLLNPLAVTQVDELEESRRLVFSPRRSLHLKLNSTIEGATQPLKALVSYRSQLGSEPWTVLWWWHKQTRATGLPNEPIVLLITAQGYLSKEFLLSPTKGRGEIDRLSVALTPGIAVVFQSQTTPEPSERQCTLTIKSEEVFGLRGTSHEQSAFANNQMALHRTLKQPEPERIYLTPGRYSLHFKSNERAWSQELVLTEESTTQHILWE